VIRNTDRTIPAWACVYGWWKFGGLLHYAGEGQEGLQELADETRLLRGQKGNRRKRILQD